MIIPFGTRKKVNPTLCVNRPVPGRRLMETDIVVKFPYLLTQSNARRSTTCAETGLGLSKRKLSQWARAGNRRGLGVRAHAVNSFPWKPGNLYLHRERKPANGAPRWRYIISNGIGGLPRNFVACSPKFCLPCGVSNTRRDQRGFLKRTRFEFVRMGREDPIGVLDIGPSGPRPKSLVLRSQPTAVLVSSITGRRP